MMSHTGCTTAGVLWRVCIVSNDELSEILQSLSGNIEYFRCLSGACKNSADKDGEMYYAGKADAYEQAFLALESYYADGSNGR